MEFDIKKTPHHYEFRPKKTNTIIDEMSPVIMVRRPSELHPFNAERTARMIEKMEEMYQVVNDCRVDKHPGSKDYLDSITRFIEHGDAQKVESTTDGQFCPGTRFYCPHAEKLVVLPPTMEVRAALDFIREIYDTHISKINNELNNDRGKADFDHKKMGKQIATLQSSQRERDQMLKRLKKMAKKAFE